MCERMGSECLGMVATTSYQPIAGLSDIRELRDLKEEAVRDILRANLGDQGLSIRKMGELEDMSGTNDAFNSSICSLEVEGSFKDLCLYTLYLLGDGRILQPSPR